MNNKGFAITTILYGIMVLFCILLVSLLGILSSYKKNQELLTESTNGTRDIVKYEIVTISEETMSLRDNIQIGRIFYCIDDGLYCCHRRVKTADYNAHASSSSVIDCERYDYNQ